MNINLQYLGQSCFLIDFNGKKLLFDPAISQNPIADDQLIESLNPDYILLSHGHGDHCADIEQILKQSNATLISTYELVSYYGEKGFKGHPMNTGGKWEFDFGYVKLVNAVHSSVLPDGTYGSNPVGFVIWNETNCFYFAGDTALHYDMKLIPEICPALDFCILPIGDNFTMGYEDARIAAQFVHCSKVIGCHYDSFPYIEINHEKAKHFFNEDGKELILLDVKQSIEL